MRITRPQLFMEIAHVVAKRSTCFRLNVGAVVVADRRIVSIGYNGAPAGHPHCSGNSCPGRDGCRETIHAEVNAISRIPISVQETVELFVTDSPCLDCAEYMSTGDYPIVKRVFYDRPYRLRDGIDRLIANHILAYRVTPAGYVIDEQTGNIMTAEDLDE